MPGRNDPCPCGSGLKYKKCHLAADEAARAPSYRPAEPSPLHALDERVVRKILRFAETDLDVDLDELLAGCFDPPEATPLSISWIAYTEPVDGEPLAAHFLEQRRAELSAREITWLEAVLRSWVTVWEVTVVEPGRGMSLVDLLTGERRDVHETSASRTLSVHDGILGRVVDCLGESLLVGLHERAFPPRAAAEVVAAFRRELGIRRKVSAPERLRDIDAAETLLDLWEDELDRHEQKSRTPPMLENTDGDPILLTTERYRFDTAQREELLRRLDAMDGAQRDDRDDVAIVRDDRLVALLRPEGGRLIVETNSIARADAMRTEIETALAGLARWEARVHSDPRSDVFRDADPEPLPPHSAEEAAVIRAMKAKHYAGWVDTPLPALGGRTPREAMKGSRGRETVKLILKEIAQLEMRLPEAERFDVAVLYETLAIR
jgi:SEC-C motif/Protein of unknown function (DUF2384)